MNRPYPRIPRFPVLALGFRPFFLLAGAFAVVSMAVWSGILAGHGPALGPLWHGHEMIFGYAGAVIAGFVLTAASNWTRRRTLTGLPLAVLVLLWVAARVVVPLAGIPDGVKAALNAGFFLFLAAGVGHPILATRGLRNYGIVLVLVVFALLELCFWFEPLLRSRVLLAALLFVSVLVAVIGGRVIPAFTRNATSGLAVRPGGQWRDRLAVASLVAFGVFILCPASPPWLLAAFASVGAASHALRMWGWGGRRTLGRPILWVLHLAYFFLPAGLALYAARYMGAAIPPWVPLHVLAVGAVGLMTLGMMTRVSLGHTGRMIVADKVTAVSYGLLVAAVVARTIGGWLTGGAWQGAMLVAAALWMLAFLAFFLRYTRILLAPRPDGRPG